MTSISPYDERGIRIWSNSDAQIEGTIIDDEIYAQIQRGYLADEFTCRQLDEIYAADLANVSINAHLDCDPFENINDSVLGAPFIDDCEFENAYIPEDTLISIFVPTYLRNLPGPENSPPRKQIITTYLPYIHVESTPDQIIKRYASYPELMHNMRYCSAKLITKLNGYNSNRMIKPRYAPRTVKSPLRHHFHHDARGYLKRIQQKHKIKLAFSVKECEKIRECIRYLSRRYRAGEHGHETTKKRLYHLKKLAFAQFLLYCLDNI